MKTKSATEGEKIMLKHTMLSESNPLLPTCWAAKTASRIDRAISRAIRKALKAAKKGKA